MQQTSEGQAFYIYTETGERLGIKDRGLVHRHGDWHRGVQLNLYNNGDLLLQRRSGVVDIAKGLLNQSLATQLVVEDHESDVIALRRGLLSELGINIATLAVTHVAGPVKITKRYEYDPGLLNREFVTLYQAELPHRDVSSGNIKVAELFWMPVNKVKSLAHQDKTQFTKTFLMWLQEVM